MSGFVPMPRKIKEWRYYTDANTYRLFTHLIYSAAWKPISKGGIDLLPGQLITGRKILASELRLSEQEIRTSLNKLKTSQEITIKATNKFSIITVCKWDEYQSYETNNQPIDQPSIQPTINQQSTTLITSIINKQEKKIKREVFTSPNITEIKEYFSQKIQEKGLLLNPDTQAEKFESFYGSKGWKVGNQKMIDWKKAVSGWIQRANETKNHRQTSNNYQSINYQPGNEIAL
ncbi:MAG: hypothetical protein M1445_09655 [Bacteroidetes bacterium]|nr:hypothetical protein [Bacteroidota bacterium]